MDAADIACDDRYETLEGCPRRDRDIVIGLWRGNIGWRDQLERMYDVFYLRCPFGRPRLRLLRHRASGDIVGTMGIGPRPMFWQGRETRVGCASHFVVLPGHRSLRPAMRLAFDTAQSGLEQFPFVYAMTNAHGEAVGKRAGFAAPGQLQRHLKPLRYRGYAQRVLPGALGAAGAALLDGVLAAGRRAHASLRRSGLDARWSERVDPRMQALWERSERGAGLSTARSTAMLEWRFLDLPALRRRFLLVAPAPGAPLLAWFACETNVRAPGLMTVTDAWFAGGVRAADRRAIRELCRMAFDAGYDAIEARLTAAPGVLDAWRAEGFRSRGQQPFFVHGIDPRRDGDIGAGMHITDIEQDG